MRRSSQILPLAILAASASAQTSESVQTVYYSTCPTAVVTTVTLPNTITYCPGSNCGGGPGPVITDAPVGLGTEIINYTTVGPDGDTTVYHEYETVFHQPCTSCPGGLYPQTFTITEECPCMSAHPSTYVPEGFSTTEYSCPVCGENGGPTTVTLTTPCATGPYANQATATSGTSVAGGSGGNLAGGNPTGGAATGGAANAGSPSSHGSTANDIAPAPTAGPHNNGTVNPPITPVAPGGSKFTGGASHVALAGSAVFAMVIGVAAWLL